MIVKKNEAADAPRLRRPQDRTPATGPRLAQPGPIRMAELQPQTQPAAGREADIVVREIQPKPTLREVRMMPLTKA